jgi:glucose/arabinose dehydrogenase
MKRAIGVAILLALCCGRTFAGTPGNPNGVVTTSSVSIGLQPVFNTDTSGAVQMTTAPGDATGLYVATVGGKIYRYDRASPGGAPTLLLDLGAATGAAFASGPTIGSQFQAARAASGSDGMFGLAFAPGFNNPSDPGYQKFYTFADEKYASYTAANTTYTSPEITPNHVNVVREWTATGSGAALSVNAAQAARTVISIGNPGHHNAGDPKFGPDGFLYFTTGDGGGNGNGFSGSITNASDGFTGTSTVAAVSNSQDLSNPLGKMIRIDPFIKTSAGAAIPSKTNEVLSANGQYFIPTGPTAGSAAGNPFVGQTFVIPGKSAPALGEIYAYGFRNPWKFSFDSPSGKLLLSNVGQHQMESILQISNGTNAAWPFYEGSVTGESAVSRTLQAQGLGAFTPPTKPEVGSDGIVLTSYPTRWVSNGSNPLQTWTGDGSAAIGGFVYHGTLIPALQGKYIFGDYQFVGGTGTYSAGSNSVTGGAMTENDSRFFFVDPLDPLEVTATVFAGNASGGASSQVNIGAQAYLLNFFPGMAPPNVTANGGSPVNLYGFGQDQNGELYALFDNGAVYMIVGVPEAGTLVLLGAGAILLLRRRA